MKNVASMYVLQWRIFAPDVVPYRFITTPWGTEFLKHVFGCREVEWSGGDYLFQDGTLKGEGEDEPILIPAISFNERRVGIQVQGNSESATAVYSALSEALGQLAASFPSAAPLLFTEETSCTAQLDFDWILLLNPALIEQATKWVEGSSTEETEKAIKGLSIRFTVSTTPSKRLGEWGISSVYDRTLAVEPRADVPLSERIYFTYSPFDSDTHLKFVAMVEASLSKKSAKASRK